MKKLMRIAAALVAAIVLTVNFATVSMAETDATDYQKSVVYIGATVSYTATNIQGISFTNSWTGTGFALGIPGEKVQYIGTAAHVVSEPEGVYAIYTFTNSGLIYDFSFVTDTTGVAVPSVSNLTTEDGTAITVYYDYFTTKITDLYALFSAGNNDYANLTITKINTDRDVAICKLAIDPTDKIQARPFAKRADIEVGDSITSIGFAGTSKLINAENRFDSSDSTISSGQISRIPSKTDKKGEAYEVIQVGSGAKINSGMSGGPVIEHSTGAIIGINSFGKFTDVVEGYTDFAVCSDYLLALADQAGIEYVLAGANTLNLGLIIGIAAGAVILIVLIVLIAVLASKKKAAPAPAPAPIPQPVPNPQPVPTPAPQPTAPQRYLYCIAGPLAGRKFAVTSRAVIGRDSTRCNVVFDANQPGISGVHCEVKANGNGLTLIDCNSSYGTFLEDGSKVSTETPVVLRNGSKFYLGSNAIAFEVRFPQ